MSCRAVYWAKALRYTTTVLFRPVDRRDEDDVAFVTLYVFEVLDKEGLERFFPTRAVGFSAPITGEDAVHLLTQDLPLGLVDGSYAQRAVRMCRHKLQSRLGNGLGLWEIDACLRGIEAFHLMVFDSIVFMVR